MASSALIPQLAMHRVVVFQPLAWTVAHPEICLISWFCSVNFDTVKRDRLCSCRYLWAACSAILCGTVGMSQESGNYWNVFCLQSYLTLKKQCRTGWHTALYHSALMLMNSALNLENWCCAEWECSADGAIDRALQRSKDEQGPSEAKAHIKNV